VTNGTTDFCFSNGSREPRDPARAPRGPRRSPRPGRCRGGGYSLEPGHSR
jgi:hypothetical protein